MAFRRFSNYVGISFALSSLCLYWWASRRSAGFFVIIGACVDLSLAFRRFRSLLHFSVFGHPVDGRYPVTRIYFFCVFSQFCAGYLNRRTIRRVTVVLYLMDVYVEYRTRVDRFQINRVMWSRRVDAYLFCNYPVHF